MSRYIDADALKKRIMNNWYTATEISDDIDAEPTADVVERKKGKWKQGCCTECGYNWGKNAPIASVPNYCPNCGADMRKETEDVGKSDTDDN